jgi:hypothetical protein
MPTPTVYDYDGYEDYDTTGLLLEHKRLHGTPTVDAGGRWGGQKLTCKPDDWVCRTIAAGPATLVVGGYLVITNLTDPFYLFDVRDGSYSNVLIRVNADGSLSAFRSDQVNGLDDFAGGGVGATLLDSSVAGVVQDGVGAVVQLKTVLSATAGEVHVYVGNVHALALTGMNTLAGPFPTAYYLVHGCGYCANPDTRVTFDDLWLADDYLGNRRVDSQPVTSDGTYQQGVASSGGAHYEDVNEMPQPDTMTVVVLSLVGQRDTYGHAPFQNVGAAIDAVMVVTDGMSGGLGNASMATTLVASGQTRDGAEVALTNAGNVRAKTLYQTDPGTSAAWIESDYNASEVGGKRAA